MRLKYLFPILFVVFIVGVFCITANEHNYVTYNDIATIQHHAAPQHNTSGERRMVDMIADDSYLIEKGDSTIFILVGNFAAHHNGAVILADSAVRYSNQSFECFGNVLINQNSTYAYGDRAAYNRINSTATLYSDLIKVVDGEAFGYDYSYGSHRLFIVGFDEKDSKIAYLCFYDRSLKFVCSVMLSEGS